MAWCGWHNIALHPPIFLPISYINKNNNHEWNCKRFSFSSKPPVTNIPFTAIFLIISNNKTEKFFSNVNLDVLIEASIRIVRQTIRSERKKRKKSLSRDVSSVELVSNCKANEKKCRKVYCVVLFFLTLLSSNESL